MSAQQHERDTREPSIGKVTQELQVRLIRKEEDRQVDDEDDDDWDVDTERQDYDQTN